MKVSDSGVVQLFNEASDRAHFCGRIGGRCPVDLQPSVCPDELASEPPRPHDRIPLRAIPDARDARLAIPPNVPRSAVLALILSLMELYQLMPPS